MKKFLVLFLALIVSAALFAGGGGQQAPAGGAAPSPAPAQPKEIRVMLANHPYGDLLKSMIPDFEKQYGIKVNMEQLQEAQLSQKLTTEFATGSSTVDVFMTRPLNETLLFNKNGWYAPLDGYDFSDYSPAMVDVGRKNGKPYIVPLINEWQVLYYRKDLLDKAGVKVPTNFTELEAAAKALNTGGVAGFASRGAGNAAVTQLSSYVYNYGARYLDSNNAAVFNTPDAVEAIRFYGRLLGNYGPQGVTSMSWDQLMPVFQAGRIAMWTDASVFYGQIIDPASTQIPAENVGVAKLPSGPKGDSPYIVVSWAMGIANGTKDMDSAMKFLNWSTSKELALKGMAANITMARNSVWDDPQAKAVMNPGLIETKIQASKNGIPYDRPFMTSVNQARDLIGEVIIESINTKGTSTQLQTMADDRVVKVNDLLKADGEYGGK